MCPTLNVFDNGSESRATVVVYAFKPGQSEAAGGPFVTEGVVPTLQAENNGSTAVPAVTAGSAVRRLTPRECERLQGFPDDWTASQSDSARYRMMGNAVTVNVANYVATLLQHATGGGRVQ